MGVLTEMENEKFYNVRELADILGLTPYTIRKYIRDGKIKSVRVGGDRVINRVSETELKRYLESLKK